MYTMGRLQKQEKNRFKQKQVVNQSHCHCHLHDAVAGAKQGVALARRQPLPPSWTEVSTPASLGCLTTAGILRS